MWPRAFRAQAGKRGEFCGATGSCEEREEDTKKEVKGAAQSTGGETKGMAKRAPRSSARQTPERFFEMYPPWPVNGGVSS